MNDANTRRVIKEKLRNVKRPKEHTQKVKTSSGQPQQITVVLWLIFFAVILLCVVIGNM